jgi:hypothetical protein
LANKIARYFLVPSKAGEDPFIVLRRLRSSGDLQGRLNSRWQRNYGSVAGQGRLRYRGVTIENARIGDRRIQVDLSFLIQANFLLADDSLG